MKRNIIHIDEEKCVGCGLCAGACREGAIGMVNGKAKLLREDHCDGLGNCLPVCPVGAITMTEREAPAFDEKAAKPSAQVPLPCGCPGTNAKAIERPASSCATNMAQPAGQPADQPDTRSQLAQWPVQIQLVPVNAPYFNGANLLIAADCAAYAYGNFHQRFMRNKITLIGCPKLDTVEYSEKLTAILQNNAIKSVTVVRMEVPCCGGIENAVINALSNSGKMIPWQVVTISTDGEILE